MSPAVFHLSAAITALRKQAEELPPFSVKRAGLVEEIDHLRALLRRLQS